MEAKISDIYRIAMCKNTDRINGQPLHEYLSEKFQISIAENQVDDVITLFKEFVLQNNI